MANIATVDLVLSIYYIEIAASDEWVNSIPYNNVSSVEVCDSLFISVNLGKLMEVVTSGQVTKAFYNAFVSPEAECGSDHS